MATALWAHTGIGIGACIRSAFQLYGKSGGYERGLGLPGREIRDREQSPCSLHWLCRFARINQQNEISICCVSKGGNWEMQQSCADKARTNGIAKCNGVLVLFIRATSSQQFHKGGKYNRKSQCNN